jgi:hypothetical protein
MAEHLLDWKRGGKGARAVFIHEIRIRSAKIDIGRRRRSRALVDFSTGTKAGRLRDMRGHHCPWSLASEIRLQNQDGSL